MSASPTLAPLRSPGLTPSPQASPSRRRRLIARLRTPYWAGLVAVLIVHVLMSGYLLVRSDFYPAGIDGNETATTIWHARNLNVFGLGVTYGLADEVFSTERAAHPFLHTHQGNWPRLFASLIYPLGSQTIESQVLVTTALAGTLVAALAYLFFARLGPPLFAFLASTALLTDYVLFAQWHVVTYRVWYGFFFFLVLLCVRGIGGARRWRWLLATVATSTGLFYFELVFAIYLSLVAAFYTLALYWRRPLVVIRGGIAQALGFALATGLLLVQLRAYLGWDDFVEDLSLTFVARNDMSNNTDRVAAFYDQHNIAFWRNFSDASSLRGVEAFTRNFFRYVLQIDTPLLVLVAITLCTAWIASIVLDRVSPFQVSRASGPRSRLAQGGVLVATLTLGVALAGLIDACRRGAVLGVPATIPAEPLWRLDAVDGMLAAIVLGAGIVASIAVLGVRRVRSVGMVRVLVAAVIVAGVAGLASRHDWLYPSNEAPIWLAAILLPMPWSVRLSTIVEVLATVVAVAIVVFGLNVTVGRRAAQAQALVAVVACGLAAYAVLYTLAPGYVFSGYLVRRAPLVVFWTAPLLGLAAYLALTVPLRMLRGLRISGRLRVGVPSALAWEPRPWARRGSQAAAGLLLLLPATLGISWIVLQQFYITYLPPESFAGILPHLREAPFRDATSIVNQAAASVAHFTGNWSYLDLEFEKGLVRLTPDGYAVSQDLKNYVWFADRHTNPAYRYPDYYVCLQHQNYEMLVERLTTTKNRLNVCGAKGIIAAANAPYWQDLRWQVVARDPSVDDRWAVVKLDWDFPPYLATVSSGENPVSTRVESGTDGTALRVSYAYRQQRGVPETGTILRLYEAKPGEATLRLLSEARGTDRLTVPSDAQGTFQMSVTPSTATKLGPEYFSESFTCQPAAGSTAATCTRGGTVPKLAALVLGEAGGLPANASEMSMRDAQRQPYVPQFGDILFDTRSQSLSRLDADGRLLRMILPDDQNVLLLNAGAWDAATKRYLGLPIVSRNGQWSVDTSAVPALNQNPHVDAAPNLLADFTVAVPEGNTNVPPGTYSVTRIQEAEGTVTRITIHRDLSQFVLTATVPAEPITGLPISMHTRVRVSGGTPRLAAYEISDRGIPQPYVLIFGRRSTEWQELTMVQDEARFGAPVARFALFVIEPHAGDTIDVTDLSASISYLPRIEPRPPSPQP